MAQTGDARGSELSSAGRVDAGAMGVPAPINEFLNREVTWLEFNRRVLHEALDERTPLLERLSFLAIFTSNLDEYFQKRVGGLKRQIKAGVLTRSPDGQTPEDALRTIRSMVVPMLRQQAECFRGVILPKLAEAGIHLLDWEQLTEGDRAWCRQYFLDNLFPVLTPLAVDPGHPFPFMSNLSSSLGVMLRQPASSNGSRVGVRGGVDADGDDEAELQFARIKVPGVLPQWIALHEADEAKRSGTYRFVRLLDIVKANVGDLFEGMEVHCVEPFRITRNADVERDEEDAEDLLELINQELRDRRVADAVRLEVDDKPFHPLNQFLIRQLVLRDQDVYELAGELDFTDLWMIHGSVQRPELRYEPWTPVSHARLADEDANIFEVIRAGDLLVHHPYESFATSVERFISTAASDPKVVAIKLTLYRTAADAPFIPQLIRAAESGKQVVCLVELKARFDEERNVTLARRLEKAGIHVVYGLVGYKTHTKTAIVVRHEDEGMRTYAHIGTGNYHSKTANLYTDLGLFTADKRVTSDLVQLFHFLTGRSGKKDFAHLLIAPSNMRKRFEQLIDREVEHCKGWRERGGDVNDPHRPRITAKMNSLEDQRMVRKLYEASTAGVKIDLIVRGFCCLRPGLPGVSENISVTSVIGRFLEHSRIYKFHNAGQPEFFIGSADWMYRNLNNRVECITPVFDRMLQLRLQTILDVMLADHRQCWELQSDGTYVQRKVPAGVPANSPVSLGTQQWLMNLTRQQWLEE